MAAASAGVRRRRKGPQSGTTPSFPSSSTNGNDGGGSLEVKKRPRPVKGDDPSSEASANSAACKAPSKNEYDEYAWFIVFLTALAYFVITRGGSNNRGGVLSSFSKPYDVIASSVIVTEENEESEKLLRSIFYVANSQKGESSLLTLEPNRRLEVILSSPPDVGSFHDTECIHSDSEHSNQKQKAIPYLSHLSSTTWVHDDELGRGYLLLADAGRSGRIWRWEVGGGPITIGRSLHMERSGCRSGLWVDADKPTGNGTSCPENLFGDSACSKPPSQADASSPSKPPVLGSASLAVELTRNAERSSAGKSIIVAEWGERRIVRVEGESGARTPLVTSVPNKNDGDQGWRRVSRPNHLMYTPFGDLLFTDNFDSDTIKSNTSNSSGHVGAVYRRKEAVHAAPIVVEQSRDAHGWRGTTSAEHHADESIDILFQTSGVVEGMALGLDFSALYVLVTTSPNHSNWSKTVYKLRLGAEDEEDESSSESGEKATDGTEATQFYRISSTNCKDNVADKDTFDVYDSVGSKLVVDEKGTMYLIACPSTVTLLSQDDGRVVGTLALDHLQNSQANFFTSINFGEDGYLYITSPNELMRMKSRVGGMTLPTNLVVPPPMSKLKGEDEGKQRRDKRDK